MNEILNFQFNNRNYPIEFPNIGKYRQIDILKQSLSLGQYGNLFRTMTIQSEETLDSIDMEAYFSILCPKLIKDLKVDSFDDLPLLKYKELKKAYKEQFVKWWNEIEKMLRPEPVKEAKEDEQQD